MIEQLPPSYSPSMLANKLKEVIDAVNRINNTLDNPAFVNLRRRGEGLPDLPHDVADSEGS